MTFFTVPLRRLRLPTILLAGLGLVPQLVSAQVPAVQMTVQPGSPQLQISRHIYGQFAEHLGRCIYDGFG